MKKITTPTLLLDEAKCKQNISRMVEKAQRNRVKLRPHFKTHQSAQVGEWFREQGVEAITVSSLQMASYFAHHGWTDILVAIPVNLLEIDTINKLAAKVKLHLVVVNMEAISVLEQLLLQPVYIWVKIDTGYQRTGVLPHNNTDLDPMMQHLFESGKFYFEGFLAHDGHTYKQTDRDAVKAIHNTTVYLLHLVRSRYTHLFPDILLSIGDTPSCSMLENVAAVDEIRPGNFVFYDLTQQHIGSCTYQQIAVCMACPVIARHPERNQLILYGGSVHFSKDSLITEDDTVIYGQVVALTADGWSAPVDGLKLVSLSQEHGVVSASEEQFRNYEVGDLLYVLPVHSCLTAVAMKRYLTLEGEWLEHLAGLPVGSFN
ncbi:alanine racemase [Pontibacter qinzhouensis]|uniref:Alanine racemase n=1 Tax=Pontibacter qinzhouensis TaxID=2603253 RepID=A0A5C8IX92_9BACT|nr:alanine racemase [Pontibacter qinzhouensis]TXK26413.1 alanine racemase [Pontibacter qinzhouensis]